MDSGLNNLELGVLQTMYQQEAKRLNEELLAGVSWENLREQKQKVIDLSIAIHKKKNPQHSNPAEYSSRDNERIYDDPFPFF